jgi:CBS domain containing-hemolysin-like protein
VTETQVLLASLIALLALDLLVVAAHTGLLNASRTRLVAMQEAGSSVEPGLKLINNLPQARMSLHLTLIVLRALLVGLSLLLFTNEAAPVLWRATGILFLTAAALWFIEFSVQWVVLREPERWAMRLSLLTRLLIFILNPLLVLPLAILRQKSGDPDRSGVVTEDELMTLVDVGQREGVLEQDEREMIFSIFRFGDTLAREVMVPRIDVLALALHTSLHAAVDALLESGFSRVPVFDGTIDNIQGLLYIKDLLQVWREGNQTMALKDILRPAYFVPETKKVDELMEEMQAQRIHMAVVVDEYGGMAGLVTLEDIVEEIIGEVRDEYDQAEELLFQQVNEDEYIFHGRIDLDDFNIFMKSELPEEEADTLGGYIYSQIGRVPKGGESLQAGDILLTVEQVSGRRIRRVRAQRNPEKPFTPEAEVGSTPDNEAKPDAQQ